jgi:group I intron endonuclease
MKRFGSIYKFTNKINGKSYIGQTIQKLENRFSQHKSQSKRKVKKNQHFYNAIKKYGWENFIKEEILICFTDIKDLNQLETYFIDYFDTYNNGYNSTTGGENFLRRPWTEEQREAKREWLRINGAPMKGKKHTPEALKKMSEWQLGEKSPNFGKKWNQEFKDGMSARVSGSKNPMFGKKRTKESLQKQKENFTHYTHVMCNETNEFFNSIADASEFLVNYHKITTSDPRGIYSGGIREVVEGKRNHSKGFSFRLASEIDRNSISDFSNIEEKIERNIFKATHFHTQEARVLQSKAKRKPIFCEQNQKTYGSLGEASEELEIKLHSISKMLTGKQKQIKGYTFRYINVQS